MKQCLKAATTSLLKLAPLLIWLPNHLSHLNLRLILNLRSQMRIWQVAVVTQTNRIRIKIIL